jgi:hypothetical protein
VNFDKLSAFRAIDKLDRLGPEGVRDLLTDGRRDQSGSETPGAGMSEAQADCVLEFLGIKGATNEETLMKATRWFAVMTMPQDEFDALEAALNKIEGGAT